MSESGASRAHEAAEDRERRGRFSEVDVELSAAFDRLLSYREVSALVGIPLGTLYAEVHKHRIPHVRLGPRTVRFRLSDVQSWVSNAYRPAAQAKTPSSADIVGG